MAAGICVIVMIAVSVAFNFSLGVSAIWAEANYGDETCAHLFKYQGIQFNYPYWLMVYGWSVIAVCLAYFFIGIGAWVDSVWKSSKMEDVLTFAFVFLLVVDALFQFCWFIVGAILFFSEVNPYCTAGHVIYDFGLTLFIIRCVLIGCTWLSSLNTRTSE